jgi:D-alanine-D-alanine ligase
MTQKLNITVLVDYASIPDDDPEFHDPTGKAVTEYHVIEALRQLGHQVSVIGIFDNLEEMISKLKEHKPDLIFNLTEQYCGERLWDKNMAGVLDMLQIPYTGSGPMGLMLCRDKRLCKQLLGLHKIRVPNFLSLPWGKTVHVNKSIRFPLVVKPAFGDGSEGIANASLVNNAEALAERAEFIHDRWHQDAIAEEYIEGRELYVSVLGNKRLKVCPPRECLFNFDKDQGPNLATYRVKWNDEYREKWGIDFGFAELEPDVFKHIEKVCKRAFRVLHLRDYGRIDVRLTPEGKIVVLEANPNPDLAWGEEVAEAAQYAGMNYNRLIDFIIRQALKRKDEVT